MQRQEPGGRRLKLKHAWHDCASTDDGSPLTAGTNLIWTVVGRVASGERAMDHETALRNARNLAHDFGVTLSPCMCSHVSCPGRSVSGQGHAY